MIIRCMVIIMIVSLNLIPMTSYAAEPGDIIGGILGLPPGDFFKQLDLYPLKGIKGVKLSVEDPDDKGNSIGITKYYLENICELQLRKAGIPIMQSAGQWIYVNVNITGFEKGPFAYNISARLMDTVSTIRDSDIKLMAPIWEKSMIGIAGSGVVKNAIKNNLSDYIDMFALDYLKANPK